MCGQLEEICKIGKLFCLPGRKDIDPYEGEGLKMKKIIVLFMLFLAVTGIVPYHPLPVQAENQGLKLGDYVQFGAYHNQPILWRVINEDADGSLMLFSEYVLCQRAFDAKGDATDGRDTKDRKRVRYGSGNWEKSNLREWLNSKDEAVKYSHQKPDKDHVENYSNDDLQAGFLYYFAEAERNAIQPYTHRAILSSVDKAVKDGGTEVLVNGGYSMPIADIVQNFDRCYYKNLADKVFLLDVKELYDYVYKRGWDTVREYNPKGFSSKEDSIKVTYMGYWLRTPFGDGGCSVNKVVGQRVDSLIASNRDVGVVPALKLKAGLQLTGGEGSKEKPYTLNTSPKHIDLKLESTSLNLQKESRGEIAADAQPANAQVSYFSSNPGVAAVAADGIVTAAGIGTAIITVKAALAGYVEMVQEVYVTVVPSAVSYIERNAEDAGSYASTACTVWDGNRFMTINSSYKAYVSQDGMNWTETGLLYPRESKDYEEVQKEPWKYLRELWYGIAYGNNTYLAMSHSEGSIMQGKVLWSKDGITWHQSLVGKLGSGDVVFLEVKYMGDSFYVFGYSGKSNDKQYKDKLVVYKSSDGINWKTYVQDFPGGCDGAAFNGKIYVSGNYYREVAVSQDGTKWTRINLGKSIKFKGTGGTGYITGVACKGDSFALTTFQGEILTSKDGRKWTKVADKNLSFYGIAWTGSHYLVRAYNEENNDGSILVSKNGTEWKEIMIGKNIRPYEIYWNSKEMFIECGGTIIKIPQGMAY